MTTRRAPRLSISLRGVRRCLNDTHFRRADRVLAVRVVGVQEQRVFVDYAGVHRVLGVLLRESDGRE